MRKSFLFIACIFLFAACTEKCHIKGYVSDADNSIIYLEHMGLNETKVLDSTEINSNGNFNFKIDCPKYPDFYRIRLNNQSIVIALDSASRSIEINTSYSNFNDPTIEGSEDTKEILKLRKSSLDLQLSAKNKDTALVAIKLKDHKSLAHKIILNNTRSAAAYYAINQMINGYYYMSPYDKEDLPYWSAVATAYDLFYPEYNRSIELKQTTLLAISNAREEKISAKHILENVRIEGFIDIVLPNRLDERTRLSSFIGNVILLDFTSYDIQQSATHTMFLRELYDQYKEYRFEIFQISLDADKLFWLEQTRNISWTCVRDENSINSKYLMTYNVSEIPTMFVIDKNGDVIGRYNHENVKNIIANLLK